MATLHIGAQCQTCNLVDFLPFTCPHCAGTFCKEHIHHHGCDDSSRRASSTADSSRKRIKGICAVTGCDSETIESLGGYEDVTAEGTKASDEDIARQVRCKGCQQAFCLAHRSQNAHDCQAPREDTARQDATQARIERAKEVMSKHFPGAANRERLKMPPQVEKKREPRPDEQKLVEGMAGSGSAAPTPMPTPATSAAIPSAEDKVFKLHCMKTRSLAKPLDPKVKREDCVAVEWVVATADKIAAQPPKYDPSKRAAELGTPKPERLWVPNAIPVGKLYDTLLSRAKLSGQQNVTLVRVPGEPGEWRAYKLDLSQPIGKAVKTGDVLALVRDWKETSE